MAPISTGFVSEAGDQTQQKTDFPIRSTNFSVHGRSTVQLDIEKY
jgi:hypothetical protein